MNKYIIKNCPSFCRDICSADDTECFCCNETDCVLKQIVELCREEKVISCNIDEKEQILKAYYHTHLGDKIFELLDIQEVE